jgi:hypothetical protein
VAEGAIDGGITACGRGRCRSNPYWSGLNYVKNALMEMRIHIYFCHDVHACDERQKERSGT